MLTALAVLQITVLTMSPGADLFARFGHTAIRVEDASGARVYNFGAFKGDDPELVSQFLHNAIPYYLTVNDWEVFEYKYRDRTIVGQVLALDENEAQRLVDRLDFLARPENRKYHYDWFRNNCTTKTRDTIDEALGGAWRATLGGRPTRYHAAIRPLLAGALWTVPSVFTAFSLGLNARVDEPLVAWQELAMPADLLRGLREGHRFDGRPLVASEWKWEGPWPRPRREPRWPQPLVESLLLFLLALGAFARGRAARIAGGIGVSIWGALSLLVAAWIGFWSLLPFPDTHLSVNALAYSPLGVILIVVGVRLARGRLGQRAQRLGRRVVELIVLMTVAELLLHWFGVTHQVHGRYVAYALVALALCWWILFRAEAVENRAPRSA